MISRCFSFFNERKVIQNWLVNDPGQWLVLILEKRRVLAYLFKGKDIVHIGVNTPTNFDVEGFH